MSVITVGTMAFDAIETPFGKANKIVGGSATYAAYAASYFVKPVQQISIIGYDFPDEELEALTARGVQLEGVEKVANKKSFFWKGLYHEDMNTRDTLVTDLNVLEDFDPKVPDSYQGAEFLMLGNLMPSLQMSVINQLRQKPKLIVLDTMNFWMESAMPDLEQVLQKVDLLMVNDSEARELTHQYSLIKAAKKIREMGPKYLIIKKGENGALLFYEDKVFFAPAFPLEDVFDPTGAGDTFAGGFVGYLAKTGDISFTNMKKAIIAGSAMASFCVEKFGNTRLKELTTEELSNRIQLFKELTSFETELGLGSDL
ncbi:PfkB family carbohydrate kinase [Niabella beijingensis]|uniref:PfkB family carbohydrate kinase n=1 Tax=Niabella beijingensis TaxID=2872700 RepID=UPI001CBBFF34|nr:PfkB family carbohydrate kinase [Niabella beijingensis]MBZ4189826.1 bifunctional hydroxymethylpyrimidine kinase/phosphomethylpyrimidine kinase [Niabella beijingensis]